MRTSGFKVGGLCEQGSSLLGYWSIDGQRNQRPNYTMTWYTHTRGPYSRGNHHVFHIHYPPKCGLLLFSIPTDQEGAAGIQFENSCTFVQWGKQPGAFYSQLIQYFLYTASGKIQVIVTVTGRAPGPTTTLIISPGI